MNRDLSLFPQEDFPEKTMTVIEVSDILKVSDRTIQRHLKTIRNDSDNVVEHGKTTYITEPEVTAIKMMIERSGRNDLASIGTLPKTDLEKELLIQQAMQFQAEKISNMQMQIKLLTPKAELADKALRDESKHYSIRDAGKHLGLSQTEIFDIMRDKGLLTGKNIPSQKSLNLELLTLRTNVSENRNYPQAVMTMQNIDNFRKRYIK